MGSIGKIELSEEERAALELRVRSHKIEYRSKIRSKIIISLSENKTYGEIQEELGISRPMINKWKRRYKEDGILGLEDAPRSGKPAKYGEVDKARVINLACSKPEDGYSNWSQRRIAKEVGMSQTKVQQILASNDLRPHKTQYWCGKSPDPEFETKMLDIVGLYLDPPENAIVLSVDEKTQIQALDRTQPELPLRKGNPKRLTTTYKRHGTVALIAALAVHQGEVTAQTIDQNNSVNFLKFLKKIYRKYPQKHLHIIADNLNVHKQKDVTKWVDSNKRITIHFTPTYSSWLNQIEIWFNFLSRDVLKDAVWHSKKQLTDQLKNYVKTYNETRAKPFEWTYTGQSKQTNNS